MYVVFVSLADEAHEDDEDEGGDGGYGVEGGDLGKGLEHGRDEVDEVGRADKLDEDGFGDKGIPLVLGSLEAIAGEVRVQVAAELHLPPFFILLLETTSHQFFIIFLGSYIGHLLH